MNILYIAKHDSGDNDDEGAITHAIESLGHKVYRLGEHKGIKAHKFLRTAKCDFVLFHKWRDMPTLASIKEPKVFWYFDLVNYPDRTLFGRNQTRIGWMKDILPLVDLGFCTDGDWVASDTTGKLILLRQGADIRNAGKGTPSPDRTPILFTGIRHGGIERARSVDALVSRYGPRFVQQRGVHGRALADLIASSNIVVAPEGPATDRYWSNRVYLTLGFGGFLLHPYCRELLTDYENGKEILFYKDRQDLFDKIDKYLLLPQERKVISEAALARTLKEHTYTHRVETLINIVKERLL